MPLDEPEISSPLDQEIEEQGKVIADKFEQQRLEDQMSRDYRPDELIRARTGALVECRLPNRDNFRTEHYTGTMEKDTKMAHIAARRHAGEPIDDPLYSVAEHKALLSLLKSIDLSLYEPQPLDEDFAETWLEPEATIRSWRPRS